MEAVDFYPKTFHEIEEQDNPAFGKEECFMIVAEENTEPFHAIVLHIVPNPVESVTLVAKFWSHKKAIEYCDFLTSSEK